MINKQSTEVLFNAFEKALDSGKSYRVALTAFTKALADLVVPCEPQPGASQFTTEESLAEWVLKQGYRNKILEVATCLDTFTKTEYEKLL